MPMRTACTTAALRRTVQRLVSGGGSSIIAPAGLFCVMPTRWARVRCTRLIIPARKLIMALIFFGWRKRRALTQRT